jgi:putative membrane protein
MSLSTRHRVLDQLERWGLSRMVLAFLALWALLMIALPIVRVTSSPAVFNGLVVVSVVAQAGAVLVILGDAWGWRRTALTAVLVGVLSWGIEFVGSSTGFPFGEYAYTGTLQPQLAHVPLVIPLAWLMMLPVAWAVAQAIGGHHPRWRFVVLSVLAFTAWDLFLDPQMVSWGYWVWANPRGYFGIPWSNYAGWLLSAALLTLAARPAPVPTVPLLIVYTITWALESIGLVLFFGLPGPGLVGLAVMGLFVALAWNAVLRQPASAVPSMRRDTYA